MDYKELMQRLSENPNARGAGEFPIFMMQMANIAPWRKARIQQFLDMNILNHRAWLGGGALQTLIHAEEDPNDYDLFFSCQQAVDFAEHQLRENGFIEIFRCPKGDLVTYRREGKRGGWFREPEPEMKVQLITKFFYPSKEVCVESFDFACSRWITDGDEIVTTRNAVRSTRNKEILIDGYVEFPVATIRRLVKYTTTKGYCIKEAGCVGLVREINAQELNEDNMIFYVD